MKILVFAEGTVIMPVGAKGLTRNERVALSKTKERTVQDFRSYIPNDYAVEKLKTWKQEGAQIYYLTSRTIPEEIEDIRYVLDAFDFPDREHLLFRQTGEEYKDVAEQLMPDILIEDDCESIGGEPEMTYPHIKPELKKQIRSIVVREFGGIDHLPDDLQGNA